MGSSSGPKDQQKIRPISYHLLLPSSYCKDKALKEHILKDLVPTGFDVRIEEIQEDYRQAIHKRGNQIQAIQC